ncbi:MULTISPECIES: hypothetical protein [Paraburkholderia]|uniref:hypothetical protein n=1 Tax=Paraburkholderia TaxID=1822464 RepID=UPI001D12FAD5|nr:MULTISPECIES: hypothetical protein [Paraburkholderia]
MAYHLALATCRNGHGNGHLCNELMRAIYVAWFLQQAGYGNEPVEKFKTTEHAIEDALARAHESNEWLLAGDAMPAFEGLLALHDSQLAVAPLHKIIEAERRLKHFLAGTASSPIPETDRGDF